MIFHFFTAPFLFPHFMVIMEEMYVKEVFFMGKVMDILETIGHFGKNPDGSYTRRLYSTEFFQALEAAEELLRQAGLTTRRDAAGNLRAVLPGTDPEAKHILLGSHLDTVPSGGLYDGAYGVAAAIGCVRRLREEGRKLRHTVEVYAFNGEEASPLGGTFGSRTLAGLTDPDQPLLRETLEGFGHSVEEILACRRDFSDAACYLETHIEQGGRLEKEGIQLGIVSGISNIVRYLVTAEGQSNHGGTTPMEDRQDAMVAMAKLIVFADAACRKIGHSLVFTAGKIQCSPNAANVVPGKVTCTFEMRNVDRQYTDELIREIRAATELIPDARFTVQQLIHKDSALCDPKLMEAFEKAADSLGATWQVMPSGAGHDADSIAHRIPVGMLFIPSHLGISHSGKEYTPPEDVERGGEVLYRTLLGLDD